MRLAAALRVVQTVAELADIEGQLRDDQVFRSPRDGRFEREKARIAPHDLDDEQAIVAACGVPKLHDRLERRIDGRIEPDRFVRSGDVVVDRPGNPDHRDAFLRKRQRPPERTVSSDDHESVDVVLRHARNGFVAAFGRLEPLAPRRTENRSAPVEDSADRSGREFLKRAVHESLESPDDPDGFDIVIDCSPRNGANGRVHSGRVPTAGQDRDTFHLHGSFPPCVCEYPTAKHCTASSPSGASIRKSLRIRSDPEACIP